MEHNGIYRYNGDDMVFTPVSKPVAYLLNNRIVAFGILAGIVALLVLAFCLMVRTYEHKVHEYAEMVHNLNDIIEKEDEYDTLCRKITDAVLEGEKNTEFNDSIVFDYIKSCKAWYPEIIMAQFKIESCSGTSELAKKSNNFFGMKVVSGKRKHFTTQRCGDNYHGYAVYDNWKLSIIDKILWEHFAFNDRKPSKTEYLNAHGRYAEDEEYLAKISKFAKQYEK